MDLLVFLPAVALIGICVIGVGFQLWALRCREHVTECDLSWLEDFSTERFRPLQRLLSDEDLIFLRAAAGVDHRVLKQYKRARTRLLRLYLRELVCDYLHLQAGAAIKAAWSSGGEDLSQFLIQHQLLFYAGLLLVCCRLNLQAVGLGLIIDRTRLAKQDIRLLISILDELAVQAKNMARLPQPPTLSS